jgi:nitrogen regulatory protein A
MECKDKNASLDEQFVTECRQLRECVKGDFAGVALQNSGNVDVTWPYVTGNRNDKYTFITVRYGKGIAGRVIASGSPMLIKQFPNDILGRSTEYPIMLAENMVSAYAYPLIWKGVPRGAILIGYRQQHEWREGDFKIVKEHAEQVEILLPKYFTD